MIDIFFSHFCFGVFGVDSLGMVAASSDGTGSTIFACSLWAVVETRYHNYFKMAFNERILTLNLRLNFRKVSYSMYAASALCGQL